MASPISKSPKLRRPVSPRPPPRYKFTIFPPDVYAPVTLSYAPRYDASYNFCGFLKGKFESHFGMRCYLPSEAGSAFIGDFDEFEQRFLIDAEYVVVVVTEKSVQAMKKFYPRLLVFVTVRPEWVNRFILVFVGNVALDPSVDLSVLFHRPIIFKDSNWEADVETWKALHVLLKVEWTPHKEEEPARGHGEVVSVIERTVVETEVQEVRTRRRTSSRSSDGSSSSRTDLHLVSPAVERPHVVEMSPMAAARRSFGTKREVETSRPVVLSAGDRERPRVVIERAPDTQITLERSPGVQKQLDSAAEPPSVSIKRDYEPKPEVKPKVKKDSVKDRRVVIEREYEVKDTVVVDEKVKEVKEKEVAPIRRPQLREKPVTVIEREYDRNKKSSEEELYLASQRRSQEVSRPSQPKEESRETSGYSSLDSSVSARSLGAVQSPPLPPASIRLTSAGVKEETTASSFATAFEPVSTASAQQATDLEAAMNDSLATCDTTLETLESVDAVQLTPSKAEEDGSVLRRSVAAMAATVRRIVWAPVSDEALTRPLNVTLLLAAATAVSPLYRDLSHSLVDLLSSVLWPAGAVSEALVAGATMVAMPVAELAADATVPVVDVLSAAPRSVLSIVSPGGLPRSSPTEVFEASRFVFTMAAPPKS